MPTDAANLPWEVLVVDDDGGIIDLILSYFNELRVPVTGASDGRAAIATLQRSNGRFGLVLTDLSLPGADGFAVLQAARHANPNCYVVIMTGYASLDSAVQAVRVGAYDYLAKPFSMGQLSVVLGRIADRTQLESAARDQQIPPEPRANGRNRDAVIVEMAPAAVTTLDEMRMIRIETALARIETRLDQALRSPVHRL
ncbi:MAG: response regulator [Vicinamibacterales bacterium]|jgi:two-component system response regulator AtoC